jgi:hypothetical protein
VAVPVSRVEFTIAIIENLFRHSLKREGGGEILGYRFCQKYGYESELLSFIQSRA